MKIKAYAKINLGLNVKGKLENGYHDLEMIMVPINFYDEIRIDVAEEMEFTSNKDYLLYNEENTIYKAVEYLRAKYGFKENFKIHVDKHIPTRAGLAGGSSDGAAVIKAINQLLHLHMSDEELKAAALAVGADVYFCLISKPAKVTGIGDIVEPFECQSDFHILLVKPRTGVSTKDSFTNLRMNLCDHPDIDKLKISLEQGDFDTLCQELGNSLEEPSFKLNREIARIKRRMLELGMDAALMSGSGSTVFGLTKDEETVQFVSKVMKERGYFTRSVRILK